MKVCTLLAALISTSVLADQPAGAPTGSPAASPPVRVSAASELRSIPLVPGPAVVVANRVNVRGRAGLIGEVIGKLTNGQPVTVIEEVTLRNSRPDEPSAWAKIHLPESIPVWVHSSFVDRAAMNVKATRLNLRGGPGENYSVLGSLEKGATITELQTKGDWLQIQAPEHAYAFVAAQYLRQDASTTPAIVDAGTTPVVEAEPTTPTTVTETPDIAPATDIATTTPDMASTNDVASTSQEAMVEEPVEEPLPPRIVSREGLVRSTLSIQAPTRFELVSPENFRTINYLHGTSTNLDLRRYKGLHIIVTGEEGLDERWRNTPVITIQEIRVLE
jgi:uncharacterized protein YgiM (DUF1202 family)